MSINMQPCKNCQWREVGCHDNCPDYLAYKDELERQKKARKEAELDNSYDLMKRRQRNIKKDWKYRNR